MNTRKMTFTAMGIVINIVFGSLVSFLKIPLLFLDTIGTVFTAVLLGPVYGMIAGGLTNVLQGMFTSAFIARIPSRITKITENEAT